jgi:hypothetical protein
VSPGKYESVGVEHSWDAPFRLTNQALFKLERHADHHMAAGKRYHVSVVSVVYACTVNNAEADGNWGDSF